METPNVKKINQNRINPSSLFGINYDTNAILQAILEISPLSIVISNLEGEIINLSRATLLLLGYSEPEEVIGKNAFDFVDPKDHARAKENLKKRIRREGQTDKNYTFVRKDKSRFPGELKIAILRDEEGKPVALLGLMHDITEVQEPKEKFQILFDIAPIGVGIFNATGQILVANRALHEIFDYPPEAMINTNATNLFISSKDLNQVIKLVMEKGELLKFEAEFQKKTGGKFWGSLSLKIFEFYGKTTFIAAINDITEQKKAEATLEKLLQEAIKVSDMKTDIITNASHELKTPLIPIIGWSEFILNAKNKGLKLDEIIQTDELGSILRNATRLQHIIDDFLDVGRIQSNKLILDYAWVSLKDLVIAAIRAVVQQAESNHINLHNEVENVSLYVDGFRIEQVLVNLLSNSSKYSPENSNVWIRSRSSEKEIEVTVEDEGFGFTPEELKDALQPFSPSFLHGKSTQMFTGTGVGLHICKGIMEQHGGTIKVASQGKNLGTKVTITLPQKEHSVPKDFQI